MLDYNAKHTTVAELLVHLSFKFYNKIKKVIEMCSNGNSTAEIIFDCMQNLYLSYITVQEMFHLRELWHLFFVFFCIHIQSDQKATFYIFQCH